MKWLVNGWFLSSLRLAARRVESTQFSVLEIPMRMPDVEIDHVRWYNSISHTNFWSSRASETSDSWGLSESRMLRSWICSSSTIHFTAACCIFGNYLSKCQRPYNNKAPQMRVSECLELIFDILWMFPKMGDHRNMQNLRVKPWLLGQTHPYLVEGFRLLLLGDAVPVVPVRSGYKWIYIYIRF